MKGKVETNKVLATSARAPLALIMNACPMTTQGLRSILMGLQFNTGEIKMLKKASDIPLLMVSYSSDVIVMDLCGEGESVLEGLRIIATCRQRWPLTPLVVCTSLTEAAFLHQVKSLNVSSICYKHDSLQDIEHCIMLAMIGCNQDSPAVQLLLKSSSNQQPMLTNKEIDVLASLMAGNSVTLLASKMHRDIRTVSTHKRNAMSKLGYRNDNELFSHGQWLTRNGLYN